MNTTQTRKMDTTKINWTVMGAVIEAAEVATLTSSSPKKQCWLNCLHKAAEVLSSNAYWYWEDELLVIVSQSKKHIYTVTRKGHHEGCGAYSNGKPCYHRALRKLLELYERADITQEEGAQATSAPVEEAGACITEHERLFEQAEELVRRNCRCSQDEGGVVYRCDWCKMSEEAQEEARQIRLDGAQPSPFKSHAPAIRQSPLKAYYDTETRKLEQALRAEDAAGVGANLRKLSGLEAANAAVLVPVTQQGEKYGRFDI